ncbi:PREDICTED: ATP-dependent Clp protease ATP-binding subunit clpA homolog CD4A, chloroplastic-like [Erythranthe guttata]|uniref:ATP-dependent Clp protease ATP-binding subunit clpA homolog CD4A, chloroplastic-like n=1 Tax=Erythranthe guttata TaxID=4155 RepID=UPI00064DE5C2|nr:PREDICTED: ATP-dependent Clp protease ATP-binding subunit clpA homolog CD4A, chloroplastic-like [Erythranthe guttata]|eukprot:XP_012857171.1 PREDICTED: ATP-dependent Clp protease ATP-binding subunit clpA homolog CD4A, chloroplastic-like [Erythranthe guttata]
MSNDYFRYAYLPKIGLVNSGQLEGCSEAKDEKAIQLQLTERLRGPNDELTERLKGSNGSRKRAKKKAKENKAIDLQLTERFMYRVFAWPTGWLLEMTLEHNIEDKVRAGEIKRGDSVIIDLDSHGNLMVVPAQQVDEPVVAGH